MNRLNPQKLHVTINKELGFNANRKYTLTHSDLSGDLYLTIASEYNNKQISGLYTRLMRDEVLAEFIQDDNYYKLHLYCHISGGLIFGTENFREVIFKRELPLVIEAIYFGDKEFLFSLPNHIDTEIYLHLIFNNKPEKIEKIGKIKDLIKN
ncbi:hypothetical protein JW865_08675 [Candidatus Bathyarchaeota archaeon]|nr:hypothetical protein [Candidatus Bathyarchaeota archaeon]